MKDPKITTHKIKRTKTMEDTIREASEFLNYIKYSSSKRIKKKNVGKEKLSKTSPKKIKEKKKPRRKLTLKTKSNHHLPVVDNNISINPISNLSNSPFLKKVSSKIGLPGGPVAGMIDIVFCCDTTGSMSSYLSKTKDTINLIIEKIQNKVKDEGIDLKFGFVAYRDHPPQESTYIINSKNLCEKQDILNYINNLSCSGGGDEPEAVMDGLWEAAANIAWRNNLGTPILRYIIHIADAPPHGILYGGCSNSWKDGCPCGITIEKISHVLNMREIHYRLVKASPSVDKMSEIFKKNIIDFLEIPLNDASSLDIKVSDMVIRELLPDDTQVLAN